MEFTQRNIERWLTDFLEKNTLSFASAEKFNVMCKAMKNMAEMHREFTEEDAKEWVRHMTPPARWTMDQTTAVMNKCGYNHRPCEFWAVMNALFSDYGHTLTKYGLDKTDVWAELAHDFIDDDDAEDMKVGRYWRDVVKH